MSFDWQTVAVAFIVAGALLYAARRALARMRSFKSTKGGAGCATGCGTCGDVDAPLRRAGAPVKVTRSKGAHHVRN
ncbi:MAG TPA: hypothetical protein VF611_09210 [Pyrinomonadaceae bacterium]|jgi:hypothetical protein